MSDEGKRLIEELDEELDTEDLTSAQKAKSKWTQLEALVGSENRIKTIAQDIIAHFEQRQAVFDGKGMIVTMSRRIAAELYHAIISIRPEWHSDELGKGFVKVVMTSASSDGPEIAKHHTNKEQRRTLADRIKNPDDDLKLVIVRDMWLTGFDVPCMHTLYIDKPMMEMLETSIKKYQNKILTAAEVIEELIHLSKDIVASDNEAKTLGLTEYEYAFYTAVADNKSARELMQQDKLRELAVVLTESIRKNASIDWTIKESVKAKLKVTVKRILRKYGYPPDMQMLATETVLKQAELIAYELTK